MNLDADNKARIAFALFLLLAAVVGIVWYVGSSSRFATYQIRTHDAVSGLIADAPIEYHGVEVGRVENIALTDSRSVRILLKIRKDAPVTAATVATITSRGLAARGFTGYVYVALEDAGTDFRPVVTQPGERYPTIPAAPSKSLSLDLAIDQMNEKVQLLTGLVQNVLDKETIASLRRSLESIERVSTILANDSEKLDSLIVNGERASRELRPLIASSSAVVHELQTQLLPEAHQALASVDDASGALRGVATQQLTPLLQSSKDAVGALQTQILPEAYQTIRKLRDLSTSLDGFASKVDRDPSIVLRGVAPAPPGPGE